MLTLDQENLHHAYLVEGGLDKAEEIFANLSSFGIKTKGNPDLFYQTYETFGIDDARELKVIQSEKSFTGRRFFILVIDNLTLEAMQALLKVFEEPTPGNHFFIILPAVDTVLPTLQSRFFVIRGKQKALLAEAEKFLEFDKKKRLDFIKTFTKEADRQKAIELVAGLESAMKNKKLPISAYEELWASKSFLKNRGASVKMILEHLALNLD